MVFAISLFAAYDGRVSPSSLLLDAYALGHYR
jgi:hypothetical protein